MKYADTHEFLSQTEITVPRSDSKISILDKCKTGLRPLMTPRFDPTRLTKAEQQEAGIMECEIDWYKALHAPLVK